MTLSSHQLTALAAFLDGLAELTRTTGVALGHVRPVVEVDENYVTLDVRQAESGDVTYALDLAPANPHDPRRTL